MQREFNIRKVNFKVCFLSSSLIFCLVLITLFGLGYSQKLKYPVAKTDNVVDDYFGTKVADPYRWLENPDSPETQAWVAAENKLTYDFLKAIPQREKIKAKLTRLWSYPRYSVPYKINGRYFFSKNDGLQNQSVIYMQESLEGEPVIVIDPNTFSADGTVALTSEAYSEDGKILAYGISKSGSDWQEIKVLNIDTDREYDEVLDWCRYSSIAWRHDNQGFYYDRYPDSGSVAEEDRINYNRVYWHKLGTPQSADKLVYERPEDKELGFSPFISDDGKYLFLYVWRGTDEKNRIYYKGVGSQGDFIRLLDKADASYSFIDNLDTIFYFRTNLDSPKGKIIAINIKNPEKENWKEIIPEQKDVLEFAVMVNNQLVTIYMQDAKNKMMLYDLDGTFIKEIELPDLGSIIGISGEIEDGIYGRKKDKEMFFRFTSFMYPYTIFRYDFTGDKLSVFRAPEIDFDLSGYESKQVFYSSKDGTRVPMFIVHKKGLKLDGNNPVLLYGYGGFNLGITPYFSISRLVFLENGGVFAVANLRGGNEYGEEWHQGGMLGKKQNVFDDFISAAEWLIQNKYTNSKKLAILGGSNGGLLVAACMVQRPELFGAVVCENALTDMLRYQKFTVGRYWVSEYGNAEENPEQFKFLYAYSPYHNVKKGVVYPPTLITTADTDDRVVPAHAKKFSAALQSATAGDNPILIRVETKAGHGGGKPTSKIIEESSDIYAFLFKILGMGMLESR
jgi:prolyl oligopeptidase